jgi:hypothetical protein
MALTRLEAYGIGTAMIVGLLGLCVATLSYVRSGEALTVAQATARAQVQITDVQLVSLPKQGEFLLLDVALKNFGQSAATQVRASFFDSALPFPPGMGAGVQGSIPPGFSQTIRLSDKYKWPADAKREVVAFFIAVSFIDTSSGTQYKTETAYFLRGDAVPDTASGRISLKPMLAP